MEQLLVFAVLLGLMYVVLILPQQRRVRRHQALIASVEVGDEIMTTAGVYGRLIALDDDTATIAVAPGVEIRIARGSIGSKVPEPAEEPPAVDDGGGTTLGGDAA